MVNSCALSFDQPIDNRRNIGNNTFVGLYAELEMREQHITQEQIDHLRELHRHALPEGRTMYYCGASNGKCECGIVWHLEAGVPLISTRFDNDEFTTPKEYAAPMGQFVAAAVNTLPALLDEVERLRVDNVHLHQRHMGLNEMYLVLSETLGNCQSAREILAGDLTAARAGNARLLSALAEVVELAKSYRETYRVHPDSDDFLSGCDGYDSIVEIIEEADDEVPSLLDEIERLRAENAELRGALQAADIDKEELVKFINRAGGMVHEYDVEYVEGQVKAFFAQFPHLEKRR